MKKIKELVRSFKKKHLLFLLLLGFGIGATYFLKPAKKTVRVFPNEIPKAKTGLSCEEVLATAIFPQMSYEEKALERIDGKVSRGNTKIALEIGDGIIKLMTATTVEMGMMEPLELEIIQDNDETITAFATEKPLLSEGIVHSLMLNKKSGLTLWSKSNNSTFGAKGPYSVVTYLRCY